MEAIAGFLTLAGSVAFWVSFVGLFRPIKRLGLSSRKHSARALLLSFAVIATGAALAPDKPEQVSTQAIDQAAPEAAPQPEPPADLPPPVETAAAPEKLEPQPDQTPEPAAKRISSPGPNRIEGEDNIGCRSRDYNSKLTRIAVQGDREAFGRALMEGVLSGECVVFKAGEPVFVSDTAIFSGLVKVRRKGEIDEYWTNFEAVTR